MIGSDFWKGKRVFITGHTGFKGSWLSIWLNELGANVTGYALNPPTNPSLFELAKVDTLVHSIIGDIRDTNFLKNSLIKAEPEIVIHMAAQPLVRESYSNPIETFSTNVMGTINLLESVRTCPFVKAVVNITTDKCYENKEWVWGYRENDSLGGYDPYSSSKACSELVTSAYRSSFFNPLDDKNHGIAVATARAGNVIGGGDWAKDRLIPDCINSLFNKETIVIRNPHAIRPWQHVLEPLSGYLLLAEKLYEEGPKFAEAWNFGPNDEDSKSVEWIVKKIVNSWAEKVQYKVDDDSHPHEASYLRLDCSKAREKLHWNPRWNIDKALEKTLEWMRCFRNKEDILDVCLAQIREYVGKQ